MPVKSCTCPPTEGLTFEEIITVFGLAGKRSESKNCCETGGYICPNLDYALKHARRKDEAVKLREQKPKAEKKQKHLRKKVLS